MCQKKYIKNHSDDADNQKAFLILPFVITTITNGQQLSPQFRSFSGLFCMWTNADWSCFFHPLFILPVTIPTKIVRPSRRQDANTISIPRESKKRIACMCLCLCVCVCMKTTIGANPARVITVKGKIVFPRSATTAVSTTVSKSYAPVKR